MFTNVNDIFYDSNFKERIIGRTDIVKTRFPSLKKDLISHIIKHGVTMITVDYLDMFLFVAEDAVLWDVMTMRLDIFVHSHNCKPCLSGHHPYSLYPPQEQVCPISTINHTTTVLFFHRPYFLCRYMIHNQLSALYIVDQYVRMSFYHQKYEWKIPEELKIAVSQNTSETIKYTDIINPYQYHSSVRNKKEHIDKLSRLAEYSSQQCGHCYYLDRISISEADTDTNTVVSHTWYNVSHIEWMVTGHISKVELSRIPCSNCFFFSFHLLDKAMVFVPVVVESKQNKDGSFNTAKGTPGLSYITRR